VAVVNTKTAFAARVHDHKNLRVELGLRVFFDHAEGDQLSNLVVYFGVNDLGHEARAAVQRAREWLRLVSDGCPLGGP
jgi:hypothetical protein